VDDLHILTIAEYLQVFRRDISSARDRDNIWPQRCWMYACFLQPKELRNHLRSGLSVAHQRGSCARLTSLTANLLVPSLNWNSTICVVYGMTGPYGPKKYSASECPTVREKRMRPVATSRQTTSPKAFFGIIMALGDGSVGRVELAVVQKQTYARTLLQDDSRSALAEVRQG
jgi:hypothetical protein